MWGLREKTTSNKHLFIQRKSLLTLHQEFPIAKNKYQLLKKQIALYQIFRSLNTYNGEISNFLNIYFKEI